MARVGTHEQLPSAGAVTEPLSFPCRALGVQERRSIELPGDCFVPLTSTTAAE